MSPTCYAWHAIASPQIAFGVIEIGSLREPAVEMWFTNPVETCHGASLRLCHTFSYPHLIFAAEKKMSTNRCVYEKNDYFCASI